eukprot:TRINITY_DN12554_c0_g4_i2.p1 TRINITY_DN12554_c0_g4~~TRINITY_DN12554_c0_g4_i2.p1  ORF type:complete len:440 (+),score=62.02 TRINITY_DN12554_c0_g4_i2:38-1321(+)
MSLRISQEGTLIKLGWKSGKWQSRYFTLIGNELKYFLKPGAIEKGSIELSSACIVKALSPGDSLDSSATTPSKAAKAAKKMADKPTFELTAPLCTVHGDRSYYFQADTKSERDAWVAAISSVCAENKVEAPPGRSDSVLVGMAQDAAKDAPPQDERPPPPSYEDAVQQPFDDAQVLIPPPLSSEHPVPDIPETNAAGILTGMLSGQAGRARQIFSESSTPLEDLAELYGQPGLVGIDADMAFLAQIQMHHIPKGVAGLVIRNVIPGGLGEQNGLKPYDFIYRVEGKLMEAGTELQFNAARQYALATKGTFEMTCYNIKDRASREVIITCPKEQANMMLGTVSSMLPLLLPTFEVEEPAQEEAEGPFLKHLRSLGECNGSLTTIAGICQGLSTVVDNLAILVPQSPPVLQRELSHLLDSGLASQGDHR